MTALNPSTDLLGPSRSCMGALTCLSLGFDRHFDIGVAFSHNLVGHIVTRASLAGDLKCDESPDECMADLENCRRSGMPAESDHPAQ